MKGMQRSEYRNNTKCVAHEEDDDVVWRVESNQQLSAGT